MSDISPKQIGLIVLSIGIGFLVGRVRSNKLVIPKLKPSHIASPAPIQASPSPVLNPTKMPVVDTPRESDVVTSPLTVTGTVPSGWMFEGQFLLEMHGGGGEVLGYAVAHETTPGSWTDGNPTPFTSTLTFTPQGDRGVLMLFADNPSGLPANDRSYSIPVKFSN